MKFSGKKVLITGAAVGIGRACAVKFASEGAAVVALDVNQTELALLNDELSTMGAEVLTLVCDVSSEESVKSAFSKVKERFGKIDILVNNAGLWRDTSSFLETPTELWRKYLDINVMGAVYCTQAALPDMVEAGWGRIINVASVAGVYGNAKMVHYSATKGALIAMTKALAKEVSEKGVTVNSVAPGNVNPTEPYKYDLTQESQMNYSGRTGTPMENAELIAFLASNEAAFISGQNVQIDGCRKKI